ncbi:MAG: sigma-70 family RNA polymerase sigma factor [Solirubrobacteraceae bacterium]|nr:sigma-70 family RNA polymerase sigma factor [Solirubrobacteraceae bacterium]
MARRNPEQQDELRRVYRTHVRAVYAFFAYSVSADLAEDLTATTFERVIKSWDRFDPSRASERTWILAIARNALTDHFRRARHRNAVSLDEHPALVDRLAAADDPIARHLAAQGFADWLRHLSAREQEILALRFGADLSAADIAGLTDHSEANVHQITSRALRRLREIAEGERVSGSDAQDG